MDPQAARNRSANVAAVNALGLFMIIVPHAFVEQEPCQAASPAVVGCRLSAMSRQKTVRESLNKALGRLGVHSRGAVLVVSCRLSAMSRQKTVHESLNKALGRLGVQASTPDNRQLTTDNRRNAALMAVAGRCSVGCRCLRCLAKETSFASL